MAKKKKKTAAQKKRSAAARAAASANADDGAAPASESVTPGSSSGAESMEQNPQAITTEKQYKELIENTKAAEERFEERESASKYLEAVVMAPSKWEENRWGAFQSYARILRKFVDTQGQILHGDLRKLDSMVKDQAEPTLF